MSSVAIAERDELRRRFLLEFADCRIAMRQTLQMLELQRSKLAAGAAMAQDLFVIEQRVLDVAAKLVELQERAQALIFDVVVDEINRELTEAKPSGPHLH